MSSLKTALLAGVATLMASAGVAQAGYDTGSFSFQVYTGNTGGNGFQAVASANPFSAPAAYATFTYTGALGFYSTSSTDANSTFFSSAGSPGPNYGISGYTDIVDAPYFSGTTSSPSNANFSTISTFLASSGSGAGYAYASFYKIDLGTLTAGTVLTITHDDGASVYQNGAEVGTTVTGPTTQVTDTVDLTGTTDTTLYYSRQNGSPSILEVSVPEPAGLTVLGVALLGLAAVRRRGKIAG